MKNIKLKIVLYEQNLTQADLSEKASVPRTYISQAIRGRLNLNDAEKKQIADALNMKVAELF